MKRFYQSLRIGNRGFRCDARCNSTHSTGNDGTKPPNGMLAAVCSGTLSYTTAKCPCIRLATRRAHDMFNPCGGCHSTAAADLNRFSSIQTPFTFNSRLIWAILWSHSKHRRGVRVLVPNLKTRNLTGPTKSHRELYSGIVPNLGLKLNQIFKARPSRG